MTVEEMLTRVTSSELTEWAAYEHLYGPLGGARHDINQAMLAHVIHNIFADKGKGKPIEDFMPQWGTKESLSDKIRRKFGG